MTQAQIEYALALYRWQSFSQAARSCKISQPSLSLQIQKLEDEIGFRIFERSKASIKATEKGKLFLDQAQRVQLEFEKLQQLNRDDATEISGHIRFATIPTLAPYVIPLFLGDLAQKAPKLSIEILEEKTEDCLTLLERQSIDLALLATQEDASRFTQEKIFEEPMYFFSRKDHPLAQKKLLSLSDLNSAHLWLLEEGHCLRDQVLDLCQKRKNASRNSGQIQLKNGGLQTLMSVVVASNGFTLLPWLATQNGVDSNAVIRPLKNPEAQRTLFITRSKFQRASGAEKLLQKILSEKFNKLSQKILR